MATAVIVLAGLACLVTCAVKAREAMAHPERPALRALCVMLGAVGPAFIVATRHVTSWVSGVLGVPNSGHLVSNTLTLISSTALQAMMLYVTHTPEAARQRLRLRLGLLVVAVAGISVSLFTAHTREADEFLTVYARNPSIIAYQFFYLTFLALTIADLLHLSIRYSRYASGALRWGLRLVAAGAVAGVAYSVFKLMFVVGGLAHTSVPRDESGISEVLAGTGGILVAAGATLPLWARYAALPVRRARQYLAYRRLAPLWQALHRALPEIELTSDQAMAGRYRRWQTGIRLYRRVIEIRDAQLILRPYGDPETVSRARQDAQRLGLTGDTLRAVVDAAALHSALRLLDADGRGHAADAGVAEDITGEASLMSESRYLEKVSAAFRALHDARPAPANAAT